MTIFRNSPMVLMFTLNMICLVLGGNYLWGGFIVLGSCSILFNAILPDDFSSHDTRHTWVPNTLLFLTFPLLYGNILLLNWQLSPNDFLSIGALFQEQFGLDIIRAKSHRTWLQTAGAYFSLVMMTAGFGTTVAHELVHRVWNPAWVSVGRWLLAPTLDTSFSIEHVHGHHANVSTRKDPASARRGENPYRFFLRSTWFGNISAWNIEKKRLSKREKSGPWTYKNAYLRGQIMSLSLLGLYIAAQGTWGIASFFIMGLFGKFYLEMINFVEHYGLARVPNTPVQEKHSWNANNRFSLWVLFNLPRHSHHHAKGHLPYWKLQANPEAPTLPHGYLSMVLLALYPPLFRRVMQLPLQSWDAQHATQEELQLARA